MYGTDRNLLRQRILKERAGVSPDLRGRWSTAITERILSLPELAKTEIVLVYMHFRSEVQTDRLIKALLTRGKTVCLPVTLPEEHRLLAVRISDPLHDVEPGYQGIPEPRPGLLPKALVPPGDIDAVIVPGCVFDACGGRLGYGGGYYDRFLAGEAPAAHRLAPAFALQVVDRVPCEPHDQLMDYLITEENHYDCRSNRDAQDRCLSP